MDIVNKIDSRTKIKERLDYILSKRSELKFSRIEAETMYYNLKVLDSDLPDLVAQMLLNFYTNRTSSLAENLKETYENELSYKENDIDILGYEIKLKRFLVAILLGMFSGKKWDGKYTSNGSIIIKKDGSHVVFHIIKLDFLENFLFQNIIFDTPSSTRHRFGSVYKELDGKYYFKLNIQLRF